MEEINYAELKKQGDDCFRAKDYEGAIEKYKEIIMVRSWDRVEIRAAFGRYGNLGDF